MTHYRSSRFFGSLLALFFLAVGGVTQSQAQNTVYSFTTGTSLSNVDSTSGMFLFTPDEPVYLVSFSYLGTDGTTPLASGGLNYKEEALGFATTDATAENYFIVSGTDTGASVVDGAWVFPSSTLLLTPDHTYWFSPSDGVTNIGFNNESGDSRNSGAQWIVLIMAPNNTFFNYRLEVAPVPEPATYAMLAGVAVLGLTVLRRRATRRS